MTTIDASQPAEPGRLPRIDPDTQRAARSPAPAPRIGIVDYGMGNRRSAEKALAHVGAHALISADHEQLRGMDGLILPGVGAFPAAMAVIAELGLDELLHERARAGVPIFGLCMGMQLLFEHSEEHAGAAGLGLLDGEVRRLPAHGLKLPHIGWSEVRWERPTALAEGLPSSIYLYHVHSFAPYPTDPDVVLASAEYGKRFTAIVGRDGIYGAQSHPEKSSVHGLALLANFAGLCGKRVAVTA
jgi:imidazole glycerol-phosphate synthase subunit HisH